MMNDDVTKMNCEECKEYGLNFISYFQVLGKVPGATVTQPTPAPRVAPTNV